MQIVDRSTTIEYFTAHLFSTFRGTVTNVNEENHHSQYCPETPCIQHTPHDRFPASQFSLAIKQQSSHQLASSHFRAPHRTKHLIILIPATAEHVLTVSRALHHYLKLESIGIAQFSLRESRPGPRSTATFRLFSVGKASEHCKYASMASGQTADQTDADKQIRSTRYAQACGRTDADKQRKHCITAWLFSLNAEGTSTVNSFFLNPMRNCRSS
jgi:hypothetical protein